MQACVVSVIFNFSHSSFEGTESEISFVTTVYDQKLLQIDGELNSEQKSLLQFVLSNNESLIL